MIRYGIGRQALKTAIEKEKPGWLKRAKTRTEKFRRLGSFKEKKHIWSEVKGVYIRLQNEKCAYCEKQLEDHERGKAEHDVEHFRPKSSVAKWRPPQSIRGAGISFTQAASGAEDPGYHLLAYHPLNYVTACKPCNSSLKGNLFPIAGSRQCTGDDPAVLRSEKPYLIYPLSTIDADPESLIRFHGLSPQPVFKSGHRRNRALVTIAFFVLDSGRRQKTLFRQRAKKVVALYGFLELRDQASNDAERAPWDDLVEHFTAASSDHTNCGRCFRDLYVKDRPESRRGLPTGA